MNHEIDLSKYEIYTDLINESIEKEVDIKGIHQNVRNYKDIKITKVRLNKNNTLNKKSGIYVTIEFDDITDSANKKLVEDVFCKEIKKIIRKDYNNILVVGLGNNKSTPDSLGPLSIEEVLVTNHIYEMNRLDEGFRRVSVLKPGVTGETGIETYSVIKSLTKTLNPDLVIVIDSLCSTSIERVNKTIQITNSGISPGSGIGNSRKELSRETLGVDVIAIGVPTVVSAVTIVSDTINYLYKNFSYNKNNKSNGLILSKNYLKKDIEVKEEDKRELLGLVGHLNSDEIKLLIDEVLSPIDYNLMVTPKEINFVIQKLSSIIGIGLNKAIHSNYIN